MSVHVDNQLTFTFRDRVVVHIRVGIQLVSELVESVSWIQASACHCIDCALACCPSIAFYKDAVVGQLFSVILTLCTTRDQYHITFLHNQCTLFWRTEGIIVGYIQSTSYYTVTYHLVDCLTCLGNHSLNIYDQGVAMTNVTAYDSIMVRTMLFTIV